MAGGGFLFGFPVVEDDSVPEGVIMFKSSPSPSDELRFEQLPARSDRKTRQWRVTQAVRGSSRWTSVGLVQFDRSSGVREYLFSPYSEGVGLNPRQLASLADFCAAATSALRGGEADGRQD